MAPCVVRAGELGQRGEKDVLGLFDPRRRGGEGGQSLNAVRERGFAARDLPTACGRYRVQLYNRQIRRDDDKKTRDTPVVVS